MSMMKRWLEDNINKIPDEELIDAGYSEEDIEFMRECFGDEES